jgi:hypothetical protein
MQTILMVLQAPLVGVLLAASFRPESATEFTTQADWAKFTSRLGSTYFLMAVAVIWFGCNNAARDIVGEWSVYARERMVSLKLPSYVFSKLAVLAATCFFQCLVLLAIVHPLCGLESPFAQTLLVLWLASLTGAGVGLLISAVTRTTEAAIMWLPIVLLPMIMFGGGIKPVHEMKPMDVVSLIAPSRWTFEALFVEEAQRRTEQFVPKECNAALDRQRLVCDEQLARLPGSPSLPKAEAKAVNKDAAEAAFPATGGHRHRWTWIAGLLGGITAFLSLAVLAVLRRRDVR